MKYIEKGSEPASLKEYRSTTPNADYDSCNKNDIRLSLLAEQRNICAFCMQRISNKRNPKLKKPYTEIEHYKSQDVYNDENGMLDLRLNYNNMLGVCNGNGGNPKHKLHCDKSKDLKEHKAFLPLTINPLEQKCEQLIHFRGNGIIFSKNTTIQQDIDVVLNLNEKILVKNRRNAILFAIERLKKKKVKKWTVIALQNEIKHWQTKHEKGYKPYCQAVIYYLEKKLKRLQK